MNAGIGAAFWLNQVFGVSYMSLAGISSSQASLANVFAGIAAMVFMYVGGVMADRAGRKWVILMGMVLMVLLAYPYVLAIGSGN